VSTPDTIIIVCSDHGFYSPTSGITEDPSNLAGPAAAWHRPYGIVGVVTAGTLTGTGEEAAFHGPMDLGSITPLDIAPTVLHAAGLPVPIDMPGRVVPAMLPADSAARVPRRTTAAKFTPSPAPRRSDDSGALARLQALGYVGSVRTSLARLNLAESFFRRGRLAQAERELRAVLSQQPANLSAQLWLAQTLDRQGRTSEALNAYGRAVLLPGGAHEALIEATDLAVRTGDIPAARRLIEAAGRAPDVPSVVHVARGALAEAARDVRAAEREYRAALDVDPISFDAGARLLDLLVAGGRARAALAAIERAAGLAADSARLAALLGEARLAVRDASGAEVALRRALKLAPDGEATRLALARALLMQQRSAEAIAILAPVGASPDRDVLLGAAYSSSRDWVRASKHLQAALDGGRVTPDVYNGLAWAELQLGRRPEAAALLEKSLEANPNQAEIRRLLARIRNAPPGEDR
jgi:Tfp pilus assembly protein PilF